MDQDPPETRLVIVEDEEDHVRELSPIQFFGPDGPHVNADFRPKATKIDAAERVTNLPTEDGHGNAWSPPTSERATKAHDPKVSPIPKRAVESPDETGTTPKGPFDST